jgi:hypothetical protein
MQRSAGPYQEQSLAATTSCSLIDSSSVQTEENKSTKLEEKRECTSEGGNLYLLMTFRAGHVITR